MHPLIATRCLSCLPAASKITSAYDKWLRTALGKLGLNQVQRLSDVSSAAIHAPASRNALPIVRARGKQDQQRMREVVTCGIS